MAAKRIHKPHRCAQESKRVDGRADDRKQEELHLKVPHPKIRRDARLLRVLGRIIATHVGTPRKCLTVWCSSRQCNTSIRLLGRREETENHPMVSSAKRAHAINPPEHQILPQLRVEKETMPVPEDAVEAQPDVETGERAGAKRHKERPVRRGRVVQIKSTWKHV